MCALVYGVDTWVEWPKYESAGTPPSRKALDPHSPLPPCSVQVVLGPVLGQGCFGTTYKATWQGAQVAVK